MTSPRVRLPGVNSVSITGMRISTTHASRPQKRCAAVVPRDVKGVARGRIAIDTRGDLEPIADNSTEAGRAQNRRVELLIRQVGS